MSISIKNISKTFGSFVALQDVSLEVPDGDLLALLSSWESVHKNVKLFSELSPDSLAKLGTCLKTAEFPPSEVIVREGAPGVSMYIIKSGLVEVRKKDPTTGIDFLVAQLSEGAAVGEMSLLTGKPRSATVTTVQSTVVFTLTRADFRNLLTQHPEISLGLARILAERLEDATKQVGIEYVNLFKGKFDPRVVGLLPQTVCQLHKVVPIAYVNNSVTLAMVNPSNLVAFDDVRRYIKGVVIEPQVCTEEDFKKFMDTVYPDLMGLTQQKKDAEKKKEEELGDGQETQGPAAEEGATPDPKQQKENGQDEGAEKPEDMTGIGSDVAVDRFVAEVFTPVPRADVASERVRKRVHAEGRALFVETAKQDRAQIALVHLAAAHDFDGRATQIVERPRVVHAIDFCRIEKTLDVFAQPEDCGTFLSRVTANALKNTFYSLKLPFEAGYLEVYRQINHQLWQALEQQKITPAVLRFRRFELLLEALELTGSHEQRSSVYAEQLAICSELMEGAFEVLQSLHRTCRLAIVTNGLQAVQHSRLAHSIIKDFITDIIISEEIDAAKPHARFFEIAAARLGNPDKKDVLIIGDSLTSDIQGGLNYGIDTCWYNPTHASRSADLPITYEIKHLRDLLDILE